MGKLKLQTQIFIGIIAGIFIGFFFKDNAIHLQLLGDIFIRLLQMIMVPLVFASLVTGVVSLGSIKNLGKLGSKTFAYYLLTTVLAVAIGLIVVNVIQPGIHAPISALPSSTTDHSQISPSFKTTLMETIPSNVFDTFSQGKMLGVIFFSIFLACGLAAIGPKNKPLVNIISTLNDVMLKLTDWIMSLAPIGVFALMAVLIAKTGTASMKPMALYMFTVLTGLFIHGGIVLSGLLVLFTRSSPVKFIRDMFPALATAFSTDSSVATLPVTMDCLKTRAGVSQKISGFIAPLGATINMDGTALYEAVAAIFIAQIYGIELSLLQQAIIAITATLASIGAAGIPSAGLVTMVIVLNAVNLPLEGIGLILAVDRILDMFRTTINVYGDSCGALIIEKSEQNDAARHDALQHPA